MENNERSNSIRTITTSLYHPSYCRSQWAIKNEATVATEDTLCAGTADKRIKAADYGGPLVVAYSGGGDQEWLLVGVASRRALDDAGSDVTSVFTRVSSYADWIHTTTGGTAALIASTPPTTTSADEESLRLPAGAFYPGTTVAFEPANNNRPEIEDDAFLPASGRRWFGQLRLYPAGNVDIKFVSTQTGSLDDQADLSDAWEERGQFVIEAAGQTLTIDMADTTDSIEPYQFTPTNSAEVTAFYNAFRGRGLRSIPSTVTLRLPSSSNSGNDDDSDDSDDNDADDTQLEIRLSKIEADIQTLEGTLQNLESDRTKIKSLLDQLSGVHDDVKTLHATKDSTLESALKLAAP